jgi:hypothetical protein
MDYETALKTCSEEVQAAIKWLEEQVRFDKTKCENRLEEVKELEKKKDIDSQLYTRCQGKNEILRRLKVKYLCSDALEFYVLSMLKSPLLKEFLDASKNAEFWLDEEGFDGFDRWLVEDPHRLWYLSKMGLNTNEYFEEALNLSVKEEQTVKGALFSNRLSHTAPLRVLASVEPNSEATDSAVRYFLDNLDDFKSPHELDTLAIGVLALWELDWLKYKGTIEGLSNYLKSKQAKEGYWGKIWHSKDGTSYPPIDETSLVIETLSKVFGKNDECVIKAVEWIKRIQKEDRYWSADACLALISVGEGPKASLEEFEWNETLGNQRETPQNAQ